MVDVALLFTGTRLTRAKVERIEFGVIRAADGTERRRNDRPPIFSVSSSDDGKPWSTTEPEGWWRDFAGLDLADAEQVLGFVKRRGLVFARVDNPRRQESTERWYSLRASLARIASAWSDLDADGNSHVVAEKRAAAGEFYDSFTLDRVKELSLVPDPAGEPGKLVRQADSLAAYMVASAMHGLEHRLPMRVCAHCKQWFYPRRSDQRFCSDSHRSRVTLGIVSPAHGRAQTGTRGRGQC